MFHISVGTCSWALQCKYVWTGLALCLEKRSDVIGVDKKVDLSQGSSSGIPVKLHFPSRSNITSAQISLLLS